MNTIDEQHRHEWTDTTTLTDTTRQYACTTCPTTTAGCNTCTHPLERSTIACCDRCITRTRNTLRECRDLAAQIPDPHAQIMGLRAIRYDQTRTTGGSNHGLPFGLGNGIDDPATIAAAGNTIRAILNPETVWSILDDWAADWAERRGDRGHNGVQYLIDHTEWAANNHPAWTDFAREVRAIRGKLAALAGVADVPAGVPCSYCAGRIVQKWGDHGLGDVRECNRCRLTWASEAHFMLAIREAHQALPMTHPNQFVTIDDAKRIFKGRIRPNLLDLWVHRGQLLPAVADGGGVARDVRGVALYRLGDINDRATSISA